MKYTPVGADAQQELSHGAVSTIRARRDLDILMSETRIFELRYRFGYNIQAVLVVEEIEARKPRQIALYILQVKEVK